MVRTILYLLATVLVITFLRGVIGLITKAVAQLFEEEKQPSRGSPADAAGELVKDPVCGVYVSAAASVKKTVGGVTHHFCSETCRSKFA